MKAICQLCGEVYAEVSLSDLRHPIKGHMFKSPDPAHEFPDPFSPDLDWEFMRCPYGRTHRPMIEGNGILTEQGMVRIPLDGGNAWVDIGIEDEVDRKTICDQAIPLSDEDAARLINHHPFIDYLCHDVLGSDNPKIYVCKSCLRSFSTNNGLKIHTKKMHKKVRR